jgi:outer membrane protein TolC
MIVATSVLASAQENAELTLQEAIAIGRQSSRIIQLAHAGTQQAEARVGEAESALLPSLQLVAGYQRLQDGTFRLYGIDLPGLTPPPVVPDNITLRVGVQQPLFTGFRLQHQARAAELRADAALLDEQTTLQDVELAIASSYWSLYQMLRVEEAVNENVTRLRSYREDTQRLVEAGLATRNDALKVEVQLQNALVAQIDARNDVVLARMKLNNAMGRPLSTPVTPITEPRDTSAADSLMALVALRQDSVLARQAHRLRSDLQASAVLAEAARSSASATRGGYWPQVQLYANYSYLHPNQRYQPVIPEFLGSWDVGVNLSFDLWNWGRTTHQAEQADAGVRLAEESLALLRDEVTLDVHRAALTLRRSQEKLGVAELGLQQAEENRRMAADRYREGLATSTDLLDAEAALVQARANLTGAQVEYALAKSRLERAMGVL